MASRKPPPVAPLLRPEALKSASPQGARECGAAVSWASSTASRRTCVLRRGSSAIVADVDVAGLAPQLPSVGHAQPARRRAGELGARRGAQVPLYLRVDGAEAERLLSCGERVLNTEGAPASA